MPFLSTIARMAYEANLGIMILSILLSFIEPFLNVYGYLPPSLASELSRLNLLAYLNSILPSALSSLGLVVGVAGAIAGGITLLKLASLGNASIGLNSDVTQALQIMLLYSIAQFVFGGFPWFASLVDYLITNVNPPVPGVALIIQFLAPGIITVVDLLSAIFTILSYIYILEIYGITI